MITSELRHPKEQLYRTLCIITGAMVWAALLLGTLGSILLFILPIVLVFWLVGKLFQTSMHGNAVHVNKRQHAALNNIDTDIATSLNIKQLPDMFVVNAQGATNALAVKSLPGKYVILFSDLIDLLWGNDIRQNQLRFIIAHELAHHAAGHVIFWTNLLMKPALFIPFLGSAYNRSCELISDQ